MSGASVPTSSTPSKKTCHCNHCDKPFARRELDAHFLCATCRVIPGVSGYRDPSKRGLESGSPEYWEQTKHQLNIVRDDDPAPTSPTTSDTGARPAKLLSEVEKWKADVFAAPIDSDLKLYLLWLLTCADYGTAVNIFPGRDAIAAALKWSTKKVRSVEKEAVKAGWIRTHQRLSQGWRRATMLYQLLRPASAAHGAWSGPDEIQSRKGTTKMLTH